MTLVLLISQSGGITLTQFLFGVMICSFLTAPLFAWMAMDTMNSNLQQTIDSLPDGDKNDTTLMIQKIIFFVCSRY